MRVFVVRHGESETNRKGIWTGWFDAALTDKGIEDAKKAGKLLKQISFEKIYTSDLSRAVETAKIAIPKCHYETSMLLREINVGTLSKKPYSDFTSEQKKSLFQNGYAEFGGETKSEFKSRVFRFMKELELLACENIAVFSHAGWLREMLDIIIGVHIPRESIYCKNCTIAIFEYTGDIWKLHSWINLL